jgi:hypothetical protein
VTINGDTKYKSPGQTKGWITGVQTFIDTLLDEDIQNIVERRVAVLVNTDMVALRLMLIKIKNTPPLHAHRVGIVTLFTPVEDSIDGSITIMDKDGVPHTWVVTGGTVYRPSAEDGGISDLEGAALKAALEGHCVTVVTTGDPKVDPPPTAKAVVRHEHLPDWAGGSIVVYKDTDPSGETEPFDFELTGPDSFSQVFSLVDGGDPHDSGNLKPGTYSLSETGGPAGWELGSFSIEEDGGIDNSTLLGELILDPFEVITVTITNIEIP